MEPKAELGVDEGAGQGREGPSFSPNRNSASPFPITNSISSYGGDGLMVGLDDPSGLYQPE